MLALNIRSKLCCLTDMFSTRGWPPLALSLLQMKQFSSVERHNTYYGQNYCVKYVVYCNINSLQEEEEDDDVGFGTM
jgi:hypothetical protein